MCVWIFGSGRTASNCRSAHTTCVQVYYVKVHIYKDHWKYMDTREDLQRKSLSADLSDRNEDGQNLLPEILVRYYLILLIIYDT